MALANLCRKTVVSVPPETPVVEAARLMEQKNVGSVVVVKGGKPVGLLTDRDMALRVMAKGKNPGATKVQEIMTKNPVVLKGNMGLFEALESVKRKGMRRFPVVNSKGKLVGIITLDDMIYLLGREMADIADIIEKEAPKLR